MTEKDFENYTTMNTENRQESLAEIRLIVCGIILFNKDNGVGNVIDENFPDREFCLFCLLNFNWKNSFNTQRWNRCDTI